MKAATSRWWRNRLLLMALLMPFSSAFVPIGLEVRPVVSTLRYKDDPVVLDEKADTIPATAPSPRPALLPFQPFNTSSTNGPAAAENQIPWGVIADRTLDTVEDVIIHAQRVPYDLGWIDHRKKMNRPTLLVLGSGWGAHSFLKVIDANKYRILVVSPVNHFVFTPMLASAAVGTVEYRSMTEAIRTSNTMIENYIEGKAIDIDVKSKVVTVQPNSLLELHDSTEQTDHSHATPLSAPLDPPPVSIAYDKLIVAVGCKINDSFVPGAREYCLRLKSCDDARKLRTSIGECLEYANRPDVWDDPTLPVTERDWRRQERQKRLTFVVAGGGPTGVELAGELSDFFRDVTKPNTGTYSNVKDDIRILIVEGGPCLVPQFDPGLREYALTHLRNELGVEVLLDTFVKEVGAGYMKIASRFDLDNVQRLDTGIVVWAAGTGPIPFMEKLLFARTRLGERR
jgi:NADH dehydrogenase FAD-containing subunit